MTLARVSEGTLDGLSRLRVGALALPLRQACAQPRGVAGAMDWRMEGAIGRLILKGRFQARAGEDLLTLGPTKLGVEKVFLFGLGTGELRGHHREAEVLSGVGVETLAVAPVADVDPVVETLAWIDALAPRLDAFTEVVFLDPDGRVDRERARVLHTARFAGFDAGR